VAGDASEIDCCPDCAGRVIKNRGWLPDGQAVERGWQANFLLLIAPGASRGHFPLPLLVPTQMVDLSLKDLTEIFVVVVRPGVPMQCAGEFVGSVLMVRPVIASRRHLQKIQPRPPFFVDVMVDDEKCLTIHPDELQLLKVEISLPDPRCAGIYVYGCKAACDSQVTPPFL
jgi:hypothetical protein